MSMSFSEQTFLGKLISQKLKQRFRRIPLAVKMHSRFCILAEWTWAFINRFLDYVSDFGFLKSDFSGPDNAHVFYSKRHKAISRGKYLMRNNSGALERFFTCCLYKAVVH